MKTIWVKLLFAFCCSQATGLVIKKPCCTEFLHRVALFGAILPSKDDNTLFPPTSTIDSVEGYLKDSPTVDPIMCGKHMTDDIPPGYFKNSIALIPRGGCAFAKKVYLAQRAGAKAAIIYQLKLGHGITENTQIGMAGDEEYAPRVFIPSAFISYGTWISLQTLNNGSKELYAVLNETGAVGNAPSNTIPMMWNSLVFLFRIFLIIWTFLGSVFLYNWLKARYRKKQRYDVVRNLPSCKFAALKEPLTTEFGDADSGVRKKKKRKAYVEVDQGESAVDMRDNNCKEDGASGDDSEEVMVEIALKDAQVPRESCNVACIESENCVICLCDYEDEDIVTVLPCKHVYHKTCIEPWLISKSALCPMCKQSIFPSGETRSLDEINDADSASNTFAQSTEEEQRRTSIGLTLGMFMVIVLSLSFTMFDNSD